MTKRMHASALAAAILLAGASAWAKLPPPPAVDPAAKEAAAAKAAAAAAKEKEITAAAEDKAVRNFQENMRKEGKPVPKPQLSTAAMPKPPASPKAAGKKKKG